MKVPATVVLAALATWSGTASAHGIEVHGTVLLRLDPWVLVPLGTSIALYLRGIWRRRCRPGWREACFAGGVLALMLALIWPLDALGEHSLAAHMAQHMLLMLVAPPLLLLGRPLPRWLRAAPTLASLARKVRSGPLRHLTQPSLAFVLHALAIWAWHAPRLYELAAADAALHRLEHLCFFGSGLLFWWVIVRAGTARGVGHGTAVILVLSTLMHTGLLGALLSLAPVPLYPGYAAAAGPHALTDQQLAGLIMWVPGSFGYLLAGVVLAAGWLQRSSGARPRLETSP